MTKNTLEICIEFDKKLDQNPTKIYQKRTEYIFLKILTILASAVQYFQQHLDQANIVPIFGWRLTARDSHRFQQSLTHA